MSSTTNTDALSIATSYADTLVRLLEEEDDVDPYNLHTLVTALLVAAIQDYVRGGTKNNG